VLNRCLGRFSEQTEQSSGIPQIGFTTCQQAALAGTTLGVYKIHIQDRKK